MTILVIGSTGTIGSLVVQQLSERGAVVRAMAKDLDKVRFPAGVTPVKGDLMDVDSMRAALSGVDTLFMLNAVVPDELTQALISLDLARDAGIKRVVYFSVFNGEIFTDVPHFSGKFTVERMIEQFDMPATILRPAYFFQNDIALKPAILDKGLYAMPVGNVGLSMVDARDIAEVAALALLRRENAAAPLPREVIEIVGPDSLTGESLAAIWSDVLGKPIAYAGDDLDVFEKQSRAHIPGWMAYDMRTMVRAFQRDGMVPKTGTVDRLAGLLGRPLRTYRSFAQETAQQWQSKAA
ncbi:MAG: NmrA/HSCARG family protein [Gemmatimonadaceae bacterium]|nr:NmrA/HSCARG family protein [Acetobacteraceae bacterium]